MLTLPVIRRQESAAQDLRGAPAAAAAGPQARAQAAHPRELVAHQQPHPRLAVAGAVPAAPAWQVHARRLLLGHGYAGQCSRDNDAIVVRKVIEILSRKFSPPEALSCEFVYLKLVKVM